MGYDPYATDALYNEPQLAWTASSFLQLHVMIFDARIFNYATGNFSVSAYVTAKEAALGPVDAVVLWPQLPQLGLDSRSQFDLINDMPGAADSLYEVAHDLAARPHPVQLLLGIVPWDTGTSPLFNSTLRATLTQLLYNCTAAGAYMRDTAQTGVDFSFYNTSTGGAVTYFGLMTDGAFAYTTGAASPLNYIVMNALDPDSRGEVLTSDGGSAASAHGDGDGVEVTSVSAYKWLDWRHLPAFGNLWSSSRAADIQTAFLNAGAIMVSDNIWGFANPIVPRDAELAARAVTILRFLAPLVAGAPKGAAKVKAAPLAAAACDAALAPLPDALPDLPWLPLFPTSDAAVVAAQYYALCPVFLLQAPPSRPPPPAAGVATNCTLYLFANTGATDAVGVAVNVSLAWANVDAENVTALYWYDLYSGVAVNTSSASSSSGFSAQLMPSDGGEDGPTDWSTLVVNVSAGGIGAVLAAPQPAPEPLLEFLWAMGNRTATPLTAFSADWWPVNQTSVPSTPTPGSATVPAGMALVGGSIGYRYAVNATLPEAAARPSAAGAVGAGGGVGLGLDVQYAWEPAGPRAVHDSVLDLAPYYVDLLLATNANFLAFVVATGYNGTGAGSRPANFLRHWVTLPNGTRTYNASNGDGPRPVTWVSRVDASAYCGHYGKRLPAEVEWQFAGQATGGAAGGPAGTDYRVHPWGNASCADTPGACPEQSPDAAAVPPPVGSCPAGASAGGLQDLLGAVWQLTDAYTDGASGVATVLRGGSAYAPVDAAAAAAGAAGRYVSPNSDLGHHLRLPALDDAAGRSAWVGFRCVVDTPASAAAAAAVPPTHQWQRLGA